MKETCYRFSIEFPGEPGAGFLPYVNQVTVCADHDPGGEPGEFQEALREHLGEWFDGAKVTPLSPQNARRCDRCHLANFFDGDGFKCWNCGLEHNDCAGTGESP